MTSPSMMRSGRAGFTLLELLVAIAILMSIVWAMTAIFTESDRAWEQGTSRVEVNTEGRAALDLISHDLQYAITGSTITFAIQRDRNNIKSFGFTNDEICVVSLQVDSADSSSQKLRAAREIHYFVVSNRTTRGRYQLVRGQWGESMHEPPANLKHSYFNPDWYKTGAGAGRPTEYQVVADNVTAVAFYAPVTNTVFDVNDKLVRNYDSRDYGNSLPHYVDIFIELLGERDARQLAELEAHAAPAKEQYAFLEKHARRYTTRVWFNNRQGYKNRGYIGN